MLKSVLEKEGQQIVIDLRENLKRYNRNASGRLSDSIRYEATDTRLTVYALSYFEQLEYGRGATQSRGGEPFTVQDIVEWIEAKGLQITGNKNSVAYAIWKKINQKGYKGTKGVLTDVVNQNLFNRIASSGARTVTSQVIKELKNGTN